MTISIVRPAKAIITAGAGTLAREERLEEQAWLDRCAEGDERAIRWILNRYRERVVRLAAYVLHNSNEAEDVAQEAFVTAFRQIEQCRGASSFYAWLYRIVINVCLDRMRLKRVTAEMPLDTEPMPALAVLPDVENRLAVEHVLN